MLVDGHYSQKVLLWQGIPHRGVLSTLFMIFTNDLVPKITKGTHGAFYVDDLVLWCSEEYASMATYRMLWAKSQSTERRQQPFSQFPPKHKLEN